MIMKFSPYGSSIPLVLQVKFHPKILMGSPERGVKQGKDGENKPIVALKFKRQ